MGGPRTRPEVKDKIRETYFRFLDSGQQPAAKEVRLEAMKACVAEGIPAKPFPSNRTVQDIIQHISRTEKAKTEDIKQLDVPWSMGSLSRFPVSQHSIPHLLKAWKASVALSQPLTNRDAIWAARLSTVITDTRLLLFWAKLYSLKERVAQVDEPTRRFDTTLLDSCLVTDDSWDIPITLITTGRPQQSTLLGYPRPRTLRLGVDNADRLAAYVERFQFTPAFPPTTKRDAELLKAIQQLPSLATLGLTEGTIWVYMYWLKKLFAGPKWQDKTPQEALLLINRLRQWGRDHPNNKQEYMRHPDPADRGTNVIQHLLGDPAPWQILADVGYNIQPLSEQLQEEAE